MANTQVTGRDKNLWYTVVQGEAKIDGTLWYRARQKFMVHYGTVRDKNLWYTVVRGESKIHGTLWYSSRQKFVVYTLMNKSANINLADDNSCSFAKNIALCN